MTSTDLDYAVAALRKAAAQAHRMGDGVTYQRAVLRIATLRTGEPRVNDDLKDAGGLVFK